MKRQRFDWLPSVAGLVTLGSPLDKHYLIWRSRFRKHRLRNSPEKKIPWFNFYDYNDPVAYAIEELQKTGGEGIPTDAQRMFDIKEKDLGFQRYPIPGKAHLDYWTDRAIQQRIIYSLIKLTNGEPEPLDTKWWAPFLPLFSSLAYVLGRTLTIPAGLFFSNRLLHELPLDPLLSWPVLKRAHHDIISAQPFGQDLVWLNYAVWLATPILLMKFLFEAEQGLVSDRELPSGFRWALMAAWLAVAFIICAFLTPSSSNGGIPNLLGYAGGLFTTILVWRLHTTIHRGLIQLWRYTKVL